MKLFKRSPGVGTAISTVKAMPAPPPCPSKAPRDLCPVCQRRLRRALVDVQGLTRGEIPSAGCVCYGGRGRTSAGDPKATGLIDRQLPLRLTTPAGAASDPARLFAHGG